MGRQVTEWKSRQGAGIISETDDYYLVRVLDTFEMYVMKDDQSVTPCLVQDGFWESWITQYLMDHIGPGTVFIDVGANTGYYSFLALSEGAVVTAYEPNPAYFDMINKTVEYNDCGYGLRVSPRAISDKVGKATLHIPKNLHGSASFTELDAKWETHEVEVDTMPLANLNGAGVYIIKIDAEGHEEKIWDGMASALKERTIRPATVLLEYTPGAYSDQFLDKLEDYAPLRWINHDAQAEPVTRDWLLSQTDWVMLILKP